MRNGHFTDARRLARRASLEVRKARRRHDVDGAREAAAKGWLATCEGLKALIAERGVPADQFPANQKARIYYLRRFGDRELRRLFKALHSGLHVDAYYDALIDWPVLMEDFRGLREFLARARSLAGR